MIGPKQWESKHLESLLHPCNVVKPVLQTIWTQTHPQTNFCEGLNTGEQPSIKLNETFRSFVHFFEEICHLTLCFRPPPPSSPHREQTAVRWPQALNRPVTWARPLSRTHKRGRIDRSRADRLQIIFPLGEHKRGPFPSGLSNNAESNIQVTHPAGEHSVCVCVLGGWALLL